MNEGLKNVLEWVYCIVIALVLALLFRYFIGTPTIVKQRSMFPTLKEDQRLMLNRTMRITGRTPKIGEIITFEAPDVTYYDNHELDKTNPIAIYSSEPKNIFSKFVYYSLEITKKSFIKRVIALEGDHVKIQDNKVYVNGEILKEDYISIDVITKSDKFNDFIVPEGYIFAMGDNRTKSTDCRDFGCIPLNKVEGIVIFRFWPFNTWGRIK
ncbi:MAG: signal peptidase I [Clostridia bacterium]|nr:signal peptidase I [Clostridia bacterium]